MRVGIIGGTGFSTIPGGTFREETIQTPYGNARAFFGEDDHEDLVFIARHGVKHGIPPHRVNYQANLMALSQLGVKRVMATYAVGSISTDIPPLSMAAVDQFIDFTQGRPSTFFGGGAGGFAHTDMSEPVCPVLHATLLAIASARGIPVRPRGVYVCTNGPRLETAAEIRMFARLGGDVVGMTGVPEIPLARELGIHFAALAYSINWAAGVQPGEIAFISQGVEELKANLLSLLVDALRAPFTPNCGCETGRYELHPPEPEPD